MVVIVYLLYIVYTMTTTGAASRPEIHPEPLQGLERLVVGDGGAEGRHEGAQARDEERLHRLERERPVEGVLSVHLEEDRLPLPRETHPLPPLPDREGHVLGERRPPLGDQEGEDLL